MRRLKSLVSSRAWIKILADAVVVALSFMVAISVRFEFVIPSPYLTNFLEVLPAIVVLYLITNFLMRMYAGRWKYASFDELINLSSSATLSTAALFTAVLAIPARGTTCPSP